MSKFNIEYHRHSIKSVLLNLDNKVLGSNLEFSLQHLTATDFFDENGRFCRGEEKLQVNRTDSPNSLALPTEVFTQIEEFDLLSLTLFVDKVKYKSWEFSWPDNSGQKFIEISLSGLDPEPIGTDINDVNRIGIGTGIIYTDPVGTDPVGTDPVGTDPVGTDPVGTDPVGTAPAIERPSKFWMIFAVFCGLGLAAYLFQNEIVANFKKFTITDNSCSSTEQLEVALKDKTSWPSYIEKCRGFFLEIEDDFFKLKITELLEKPSQSSDNFLLDAGKFYDPNVGQHLLKTLKPEVETNVRLAIRYYSIAKNTDISGAEALLRTACQKLENPTEKILTKKECKGFLINE